MKKKNLWLIIAGSVVAAAVIGIAIFLIVTKSVKPSSPDGAPQSIDGTWCVVSFNSNVTNPDSAPVYTPNQTITLQDGKFSYRQGDTEVAAADYEFSSGSKDLSTPMSAPYYRCGLTLSNPTNSVLPEFLVVRHYTTNVIELIDEMSGKEWRLIALDGTRTEYAKVTAEYLKGKWDVVLKGHDIPDAKITITETTIEIDNSGKPPVNLTYTFDEGEQALQAPGIGKAYTFKPSDNALILVVDDGSYVTIWEATLA